MKKQRDIFLINGLVALIFASALFFFSHSVLKEFLITQRHIDIVLSIKSENPFSLTASYNLLPNENTQSHTIEVSGSGHQDIRLPFPKDQALDSVLIYTTPRKCSFELEEIYLENAFGSFSCKGGQLLTCVNARGRMVNEKMSDSLTRSKNVPVSLSKNRPMIVLNKNLTKGMYDALEYRPFIIALSISALSFLVLLLFLHRHDFARRFSPYELIFTLSFLLILFIPFISPKNQKSMENRVLTPFPDLSQLIWKIPKNYTDYYNDHFPFRHILGEANSRLRFSVFDASPMPDHVRIGKENWLFYNIPEIRDAYIGDSLFTDEELARISRILDEKRRWLEGQGVDFYFLIAPLKHEIYPEYLPASLKKRGGLNKREQVIAYLKKNSKVQLIDPHHMLLKKKESDTLYYKNDTHWNRLGAFFVYQFLMQRIKENHPEVTWFDLKDYRIKKSVTTRGDLADIMNASSYFIDKSYEFIPNYETHAIDSGHYSTTGTEKSGFLSYHNDHGNNLRLLIFRDSFSFHFERDLVENFSFTGLSWTTTVIPERVLETKPDIVVFEMMQRYLNELLVENSEIIRNDLAKIKAANN